MAKILVVDDAAGIRNQVSTFLSEKGYTVIAAEDGADGLKKLRENPEVSLIVSDVNMPGMDGITMVESIRKDLGNTTVNVLMLTTERRPDLKERAKAAGVKGWLVKPFNGDASLPLIQKLVG